MLRTIALLAAFALALTSPAHAQTAAALPSFAGFTIGEPLSGVRDRLGDPLLVDSAGMQTIWRYLCAGGAYVVDLLVKDNAVFSITVLARAGNGAFVDPNGIALGANVATVRARLGKPAHEQGSAVDGSLDLWYADPAGFWIYEFKNGTLDFIQIVLPPGGTVTLTPGSPVTLGDGTSFESAVQPGAQSAVAGAVWIDAYVHEQECGNGGRWIEQNTPSQTSQRHAGKSYAVVAAACTDGGAKRSFYFETTRFSAL
jgi:hypothetical protein